MRKYLVLMASAVLTQPAAAQDSAAPGETRETIVFEDVLRDSFITVLANGLREPVAFTGQPVTVFDRAAMDGVQGADLTRLLERAPGVTLSRNGGPGAFTAVRVRGAAAEQLLVLIDGVRVADVASPGGGFDFGTLLMGNLAKAELLRSSNSTLWGSHALGGVLALTTGGDPGFGGSVEYGAHDSFYGTASAQLTAGPAVLGADAGHFDSDGFSAAASGTEPDGLRHSEASGRARVALGPRLAAFATARYADARAELDGFPAPAFTLSDTAEYQDTRQLSGAGGFEYAGEALEVRATFSLADTERANFDPAFGPAPSFTADGESERAELRGRWRFAEGLALDFGAEREWQRFATLFDAGHATAMTGAYAQLDYDRGPLHLAAGVRRDEHRDFGGAWSLGADAAFDLSDAWRVTASYGEGFKAPTLFQLHSDFGNSALRPERSRSFDVGIAFRDERTKAALSLFRRDTEDLIGFVSCFGVTGGICAGRPFGTYDNTGRARAEGVEIEAETRLGEAFTLGAVYSYIRARDRTSAARFDLARQPRHALTATAEWRPAGRVMVAADLRVVSKSFDDAANFVPLGGHEVMTLRASWDIGEHVTLFGRVENLWDETYQTAAGYATAGRGAYLGARARW